MRRSADDATWRELARAVVAGDENQVKTLLRAAPELATHALTAGATRQAPLPHFLEAIEHYVYEGDTALHIAAAAYRRAVAEIFVARGADVGARNRRGAEPLHYAADGGPTSRTWNPAAQAEIIAYLISAGANPNALDKSGVAPLHRAVRNRCTSAVRALLDGGANPRLKNKAGSAPLDLATRTTGRGGSGTPEAKSEQAAIVRLLGGD
ncbi:MAG: ankyrin repeat domain-containing protein [Polyangiaceae bacterium]